MDHTAQRARQARTRSVPLLLTALSLIWLAACSSQGEAQPEAETVLTGRFLTLDPERPEVEAVAVAQGRILALGSRDEIQRLTAATTRTIAVPGVGLPGFADAHVHIMGVGSQLQTLDLRGLSKKNILEKVAEAIGAAPKGTWIQGRGWDEGFWAPAVFPTASELDVVSPHHPVLLSRIDGHSVWVNSRVLALAGVTKDTPDPPGGLIRRDRSGAPTGMFVDRATRLVTKLVPPLSRADRATRIRAALDQYAEWGLTSVHDAGADLEEIEIYKQLLAAGDLPVRLYVMAQGTGRTAEEYLARGPEINLGDGRLTIRSFKILLDGALGSRGAEMTKPYADAPDERGLRLMDDAAVDELVRASLEKGFQVNAHAIGDRAVTRALDAYERGGVRREQRFRIEHASIVSPESVPRFAGLGVIASMQPVFVGEYGRWAEDRVGLERAAWVIPTWTLLDAGAVLASGSDYPASDAGSPIATLHCLVTREGVDGKPAGGWHIDERVDVDTSLRSMTEGPAFAAFQETDLGRLTVGRFADVTVLSANPYELRPEQLQTLSVRMTVVAGRVTFDAATQTSPASSQ